MKIHDSFSRSSIIVLESEDGSVYTKEHITMPHYACLPSHSGGKSVSGKRIGSIKSKKYLELFSSTILRQTKKVLERVLFNVSHKEMFVS